MRRAQDQGSFPPLGYLSFLVFACLTAFLGRSHSLAGGSRPLVFSPAWQAFFYAWFTLAGLRVSSLDLVKRRSHIPVTLCWTRWSVGIVSHSRTWLACFPNLVASHGLLPRTPCPAHPSVFRTNWTRLLNDKSCIDRPADDNQCDRGRPHCLACIKRQTECKYAHVANLLE